MTDFIGERAGYDCVKLLPINSLHKYTLIKANHKIIKLNNGN